MPDLRDDLRRPLMWAIEKILDDVTAAVDEAEAERDREASRRIGLVKVFGYWIGHLRRFVRDDGQDAATWLLRWVEVCDVAPLSDAEWAALAEGIDLGADHKPFVVSLAETAVS